MGKVLVALIETQSLGTLRPATLLPLGPVRLSRTVHLVAIEWFLSVAGLQRKLTKPHWKLLARR